MQKQLSKYQKFEAQTIERTLIKNAPYNPRVISDENKKKLKSNIKRVGLLDTLVWNKRSGNLVSGHQRLSILDILEGNDKYLLTVSVCDLDEKTEKEQNVFFNQTKAQGEYDLTKLEEWDKEDIDWSNTGFNDEDISWFKAANSLDESKPNEKELNLIKNIESIKDAKKESKKNVYENYFCCTFKSSKEKNDFIKKYGFEEETKYIDGEILEKHIKNY